ncbi:retrovirus-related pol polyprotein from transposon TNT 1-94, partial [Tanacetum coccineum]
YPTNSGEDLGKLKPKVDIGIFVGYAPAKKAFRIYNKRTRMIIETIHVDFDELTTMASKQFSSGSGLPTVIAEEPAVSTGAPSLTTIDHDAPSSSTSQITQETPTLVIPLGVEEADHDIEVAHMDNNPFVEFPIPKPSSKESSTQNPVRLKPCKKNSTNLNVLKFGSSYCVMIITLKWIYKVKLDELGGVLKNKARLVARGYREEEGIDFE